MADLTHHKAALRLDGFAVMADAFTADDLGEAQKLLDPMFDRFDELSTDHAVDLGIRGNGAKQIHDINRAVVLEPRLCETSLFRKCRRLANELLGRPALFRFDHAIYKPGRASAPTPWHQDQAFVGLPTPLNALHFWIPFQDATTHNGCMWFIPGSHLSGNVPHSLFPGSDHSLHVADVPSERAQCCPVSKGGLTIHTPLTLHMTGANETTDVRRVWILHFAKWGRLGYVRTGNLLPLLRRAMLSGSSR